MKSSPVSKANIGLYSTIGGMPGSAPRSRSSRLGLVAAVIATESPSHPSPLVIHSTLTGRRWAAAALRRGLSLSCAGRDLSG